MWTEQRVQSEQIARTRHLSRDSIKTVHGTHSAAISAAIRVTIIVRFFFNQA
jgi:hypothetical protein